MECKITVQPEVKKVVKKIELTDTSYFEDVSWTIAYSPSAGRWIGWYSFQPNYYIHYQNFFKTGVNKDGKESVWSHLLTNKSYRVFYGERYPFILDYSTKKENVSTVLQSVNFQYDVMRYHNEWDYAMIENKPINKMWIYSRENNSGELRLVHNTGQLSLVSKYPKTDVNGKYQEVLVTRDNRNYNVNYIYNRVVKMYNAPIWRSDRNNISKTLNNSIIRFSGKNILEPIRGSNYNTRLQQDEETRLKYVFYLGITNLMT